MRKTFWIISIVGALIGVAMLLSTLTNSKSAPQQAAGASIALSFTIIPYCLARAVSEIKSNDDSK